MSLDIIGKMYNISGDAENPTLTELSGWHVNSTKLMVEWGQWEVEPSHKRRVFAGVNTYCYRFDSEEQFKEVYGDE